MINSFFRIKKSKKDSNYRGVKEDRMQYTPPCPLCKRVSNRILPLSIAFTDNKPLGDFTWLAPDVLVSEKAKRVLLEEHSINESVFAPVLVEQEASLAVWHLNILAKCPIDTKCDIQLLETCSQCNKKTYSTWKPPLQASNICNGYPIFRFIEHPGMIFIAETLKQNIRNAKLSNIDFEPIEEVQDSLAWMRPRQE
jgi:hypothetical protein